MTAAVERFESRAGARVYRLPLEVFPGFWGYAHLVLADGFSALVDSGSGFGKSNDDLDAGPSTPCAVSSTASAPDGTAWTAS